MYLGYVCVCVDRAKCLGALSCSGWLGLPWPTSLMLIGSYLYFIFISRVVGRGVV